MVDCLDLLHVLYCWHVQVAYLADSELSSWVTGTVLTVDGGHSVRNLLE
jgi:enoyl-[acyl-carrier-protein] reductase (NADH)